MARESGRLTETLSYSENSNRLTMTGRLGAVLSRNSLEEAVGVLVTAIEAFNDKLKPVPSGLNLMSQGSGTFTVEWAPGSFENYSADNTGFLLYAFHEDAVNLWDIIGNKGNYIDFLKSMQQAYPASYLRINLLPVDPFYYGVIVGDIWARHAIVDPAPVPPALNIQHTFTGLQAGTWHYGVFRYNPFGVSSGTEFESVTIVV